MSGLSWTQKLYWSKFGKPVSDRALFAALLHQQFDSILEVGVGDGARMRRIAKLAQTSQSGEPIRYIGTDEFESASDAANHLSLKQAHQLSAGLGFKATLIPGNATSAMPRVAHKFGPSDLVIIDSGIDTASPLDGPIGTWLDRIAHSGSTVLASQQSGGDLVAIDVSQLNTSARIAA